MKNKFITINGRKYIVPIVAIYMVALGIVICKTTDYNTVEVSNTSRLLPIYSVETDKKQVAITFDCAWGADDISSIIDTLNTNDVTATFFTVGTWVDSYPEAVRKLSEARQEIGNHSNSHAHVNNLSYDANILDMKKCNEKIQNITGKRVTLYRGPYGEYNNIVIESAESLGMKVIQWDIDTLDYMGKSIEEMCNRIKSKIRNGSIILMHNDTENTAKGLQQMIDTITEAGYEIVPLNDLIYHENYEMNYEGRQIKK